MNDIDVFLYELRKKGIDIELMEDELKLKGKKSDITSSMLADIKIKKQAIINHLKITSVQYYPILTLQKRMCVSYYATQKQSSHNLYSIVALNDDIDIDLLKKAFQQLIHDHEILRTGYQLFEKDIVQVIFAEKQIDFESYILDSLSQFEQWAMEQVYMPFSLEKGQVIRVKLVKNIQTNSNLLVIIVHHVACDFESLQLILSIIYHYYQLYLGKTQSNLSVQQYKQVVLEERSIYNTEIFQQSLNYWQGQLDETNSQIAFAKKTSKNQSHNFLGKSGLYIQELGLALSEKIAVSVKQLLVSPHNFLLALFAIIVSVYSGQRCFHIGIPISKRKINQQQMLGMFIDTYWLKADVRSEYSFVAFVKLVKKLTLNMLPYMQCGFFDILEKLNVPKSDDNFPIFQVSFNWIKSRIGPTNPLVKKYYGSKNTGFDTAPYELLLNASDEDRHIKLLWIYNSNTFSANDIMQIAEDYRKLITTVCDDINITLMALLQMSRICECD